MKRSTCESTDNNESFFLHLSHLYVLVFVEDKDVLKI